MHKPLLLEISRCSEVIQCLKWNPEHPCSKIIGLQGSASYAEHQLPEPCSGQINIAPILFISSNPSISEDEIFPTGSWKDSDIVDFYQHRFGGGKDLWVKDGLISKDMKSDVVQSMKDMQITGADKFILSEL